MTDRWNDDMYLLLGIITILNLKIQLILIIQMNQKSIA